MGPVYSTISPNPVCKCTQGNADCFLLMIAHSHLASWIQSYCYLCNRSQQVVLNGSSLHKSHAFSGVPQCSILGPLLFILYINSLSDIPLSLSSKLILYADDILYSRVCNSPSDISLIQSYVNRISTWISSHYLTSKTKYMFLSFKPSSFFFYLPLPISQWFSA